MEFIVTVMTQLQHQMNQVTFTIEKSLETVIQWCSLKCNHVLKPHPQCKDTYKLYAIVGSFDFSYERYKQK